MDDKNDLIKEHKNIKDDLPNEIFMNILYNLKDFNDLLNTYNYFENHNYLIDIEIDKYLNIKNIKKKERNWMAKILSSIEFEIRLYIIEINKKDKKEKLENLGNNKNDISKKIIKYHLRCDICDYIYKFNEIIDRHFYNCINCEFIFCQECCIKCDNCDPYDSLIYYHCLDCNYNCVKYIKDKINKTHRSILNENNEYTKSKEKSNMENMVTAYCKNMIKMIDGDEIYDIYNLLITKDFNDKNIQADRILIFNDNESFLSDGDSN